MIAPIPVELPAWLYVVLVAALVLAIAALIMAIGAHVILASFRDQIEQASDDADKAVRLGHDVVNHLAETEPPTTGRHTQPPRRALDGEQA